MERKRSSNGDPSSQEKRKIDKRNRTHSTVENVALAAPRFIRRYYLHQLFHSDSKLPRQQHWSERGNTLCQVVICFLMVTVAFLGFLVYCGSEVSPQFLREIPTPFRNILTILGSYGLGNMLIALILMLLIMPIPFRLFGSLWVSFSTAEPVVYVPKAFLNDLADAIDSKQIDSYTMSRIVRLVQENNLERGRRMLQENAPKLTGSKSKTTSRSWWSFIAMQLMLASASLISSYAARVATLDHLLGRGIASMATGLFSVFCLCLAIVATHGVGGRLKYDDFNFYQPFAGGAAFCVLQGVSWTLFSMSVFAIGLQSFCSVTTYLQITCFSCIERTLLGATGGDDRWILTSASTLGFLSEIMMILSLFAFRTNTRRTEAAETLRDSKVKSLVTATTPYRRRTPVKAVLVVMAWTMIFIKPEMIFFACFFSTMKIVPLLVPNDVGQPLVILGWIAASCAYAYTYVGNPSRTGRRNWPAFREWVQNYVFDPLFEPYFAMRLVRDTKKPFPVDRGQRYIFGYHPHAIIPLAAGWCSLTKQWKHQFPGIEPSVLTSSILHNIPIARDVIQWSGGRDVSWNSFQSALKSLGSTLLIPGGQLEMIGSHSRNKHVTINVKHRGFVRMGLVTGSALVPIYCFGAHKTFDNLPFPESWQRWCMKALRANILFLPYGNWLFVPRTGPLTIVVGAPLLKQVDEPSEAQVTLMHRRYYTSLLELFEKYKVAAGYADGSLVFSDPKFETLGAKEFEALWKSSMTVSSPSAPRRGKSSKRRVISEFFMATTIVILIFVAAILLTLVN